MTPYMQNAMCQTFADEATHLSLHTANPGDTGASELTGGGYARAALTWGTPTGGEVTASAVAFSVPADTVITHIGFWNGSTFLDSKVVNVTFVSAGTYGPQVKYDQLAGV